VRELLTMSYASGALDIPLSGETIPQVLDRVADQFPNRDAVISRHQNIRRTYAEFRADVNQLAKGLHALGVRKGERAGIWSANNYEWLMVQFATAKLGVILVNINPAYRTIELEYSLKKSGVRTLIMALGFRSANYVAMIQQICPELNEQIRGEWRSERMPDLREVVVLGETPVHGTYTWAELLAMGDDIGDDTLAAIGQDLEFDDPINIQYTSGTTGFPKGVTLSHHNIVNNGKFVGWAQQITEQDRICIPGAVLPLLRHGAVEHGRRLLWRCHGAPERCVRSADGAAGGARGALHDAPGRADHVPGGTGAS
jgi:fatty-acyl-CoA synthase